MLVVGQRRLVVIEHRPTSAEPHQGVVVWMSALENVAKLEMEFKPAALTHGPSGSAAPAAGVSAADVAVALKVEVKQGANHVFVLGLKESTTVVQSIYARLNGEEPPVLTPAAPKRRPHIQGDERESRRRRRKRELHRRQAVLCLRC